MAVLFSRSCIAPRIRACPWQPLFAFTFRRELFAFRQREPQFAPLLQLPPASKAPGIYNNTAGILISQHCSKRKKLRRVPCSKGTFTGLRGSAPAPGSRHSHTRTYANYPHADNANRNTRHHPNHRPPAKRLPGTPRPFRWDHSSRPLSGSSRRVPPEATGAARRSNLPARSLKSSCARLYPHGHQLSRGRHCP